MTTLNVKFPIVYRSLDNHPDDGIVAKRVLERTLGIKIKIKQRDFKKEGGYVWDLNLTSRPKKVKPYYVVIKYVDQKWTMRFVDYERSVAKDEMDYYKYNAERGHKGDFKLLKFVSNDFETITQCIAKLPPPARYKRKTA